MVLKGSLHYAVQEIIKLPEVIGLSVLTVNGSIITTSMMDLIDGVLQRVSIGLTIAVSLATLIYIIKKTKALNTKPKDKADGN